MVVDPLLTGNEPTTAALLGDDTFCLS